MTGQIIKRRTTAADVGALASNGTAAAASKLATARTFPAVNLASTATSSFDGSKNPTAMGVSGTLPVSHGGTGATAVTGESGAVKNLFSTDLKDDTTPNSQMYFTAVTLNYAKTGFISFERAIQKLGIFQSSEKVLGGDCNNLLNDGIYRRQGTTDAPLNNAPTSSSSGMKPTDCDFYILVMFNGTGWVKQVAFDVRTDYLYVRTCNNSSWGSWKRIHTD